MAYTQFTEDMEILQKENDRPNALGNPKRSAADMKELFDEAGIKIKDYLNNTLLPELDNTAGDLVTDEAAIAQNATDIVALKAKKRFVYADADIAYNTTTTTSILKAKLHPSGEVGDYVIGKNGGVAVIVSQLDATRWNITTQQMSVRPPYSASQIGYSSQSEIYPTPPADVEEALAGLEGNVEGLINDVESLESSVTDLEARTKLVYYTGVIDTTKSTSTDQTGYLPDYKPNDDIIPGDCFIDDYGSIGVVTAISGTTVTYRYTGEKFNGLAENVLYGSLSPIYPAAPGNVSQALSGLEGVAETLVDDVGDLKAEASFVFFEGTISTTSTVLSQYSTTSHFYPNVKDGCYFVDSKGAVGRVLGVSGTDVVFVFSGMRVLPTAPEFSSVTVQDSSGGVTIAGLYIGENPVLGLSETGDDDRPIRVLNVATPTLGTDAANKAYVDAHSGAVTPAAVVTSTGAMTSEQKAQTRQNIGAGEPLTPQQIADGAGAWLENNLSTPSTPPIDSTLSVANAAADAKVTGDNFRNLLSYRDVYNGLSHYASNSAHKLVEDPYATSVLINAKTAFYDFTANGNMSRFILFGVDSSSNTTEIFRYTSDAVPNPATYTYHNITYPKLLLILYYGSGVANITSVSIIEHISETVPEFSVGGISVLTKDQTLEEINTKVSGITSYKNVFNGLVGKRVNSVGEIAEDQDAKSVIFDAKNLYYNFNVNFNVEENKKRFVLYGTNDGINATEIFRYTVGSIPNPARYVYHNSEYSKLMLSVFYGTGNANVECTIYENDSDTLPQFSVSGVDVLRKDEAEKILELKTSVSPRFTTTMENRNIDSLCSGNLYLIAVKADNTYYGNPALPNGRIPCAVGYLYLNQEEQKLYYSSGKFDNPVYLCDWDSTIVNGDACQSYHCTITKDGDLIFWKSPYNNRIRSNPIIYPNNDYSNPYVIDFGNDIKPFGFAVDSGIDHCYNGDYFMYGEYRGWAVEDNDTPIYIWKVVKPYNTKSCWSRVCTKYVRHYQSDPGSHPGEEIGHFHTCNFDFYSGAWIASTGDVTYRVKFLMSKDNGVTWVDQNAEQGQASRAVGVIFTKEGMYYGTDATGSDHALYFVARGGDGFLDFTTQEKICDLSGTGAAGYGTALMREPHGLLFIDRMEHGAQGETTLPMYFYDLKNNKLIHLMDAQAIEDYNDYDLGFGLPPLAFTHYQSPYEDGIIMGSTTVTKPFLLDLVWNKKDILVGVLKMSLY